MRWELSRRTETDTVRGVDISQVGLRTSSPRGVGHQRSRWNRFIGWARLRVVAILLLGISALLGSRSSAAPPPQAYFRTLLTIPEVSYEASPSLPGSWRVHLKGYGTLSQPGAPAVPLRIERIALPESGDPVLQIKRVQVKELPSRPLDPVPAAAGPSSESSLASDPYGPPPSRAAFKYDPALAGSDSFYPGEFARLGQVGYLRDQRYVELILTPLQYRPHDAVGRIAREVELEIVLTGAAAEEASSNRRRDPRGESMYQGAFLNTPPPPGTPTAKALLRNPSQGEAVALDAGGGVVYKVGVHQEGVYRISCPSAGSCLVPGLLGLDPATFRLRLQGAEVPLRVIGGQDGSFDPGDILEFYGQIKADPFTVVNCAPPTCATPVYEDADYTDTNVYLLDAPGSSGRLRMSTLDGTPGGLSAAPTFLDTAHVEVNNKFSPLGDHDPFYWLPTMTAGDPTNGARDLSVPLPGLALVSTTSPVTVRLRGVTSLDTVNPDHRTQITVNGQAGTTTTMDWDGEVVVDQTTSINQSLLVNPSTVNVTLPVVGSISVDQILVDYAEISYQRQFQAVSDLLAFNFPNQAAKFFVQGFSGSAINGYDVSQVLAGTAATLNPRLVTNPALGATSLTFQIAAEGSPTGSTRRLLVVGPGGYLSPDFITPLGTTTLLDTSNEADYIILAHPSLIDTTPGSAFNQFVTYLSGTRGLSVKLVLIQDVYDAFNNSIEDPEAIRSFLAYAHDHWIGPSGTAPPPAYLLLVGDAIWDPKNNLDRSDWIDLVPTVIMFYDQSVLKYYSADTWLASFVGNDQSPDIRYGRFPVRTLAQAEGVFAKTLAYAQSAPPGSWRSDGYFLADVGNVVQETQLFEGEEDQAASNFTPPWTETKQYYAEPPYNAPTGGGGPVDQFKADFVSHWNNSHPALASFSGHGAFDILGNDLFFRPADVPLLTNGSYQPFFYNSDCLSGGFHAVGVDSMAETFLESTTGGSIAYFAPAGLSFTFFAETVSDQMFADLFGPEKLRELGLVTERARGALYQQGAIPDAQGFAYVGEPSLSLAMPAPAPPQNFSLVSGNGTVNLSWTASPDPAAVGTNLYRTSSLTLPYAKVNGAPLTATSYSDTTVVNGTTYFYRAVSVDASSFEGAVTNTNDDCGASGPPDGPQCRRATPKNLVPPVSPQGVKVLDTGTGTTLQVSWQPNPETDIQRYTVAYGTAPGSHPLTLNAGLSTSVFLNGLMAGVPYYVVVFAVNTSGVQGANSAEVSGTPHVFQGIAPPATIKDLMLSPSGSNVVLTWSPITVNIYGNPTVIDHYNIYRGNTPDFIPADGFNRLGQIPASSTPTYTHTGGMLTPDNGYYLVSAVDTNGFSSGLGADLPAGIVALDVEPSPTAGMLRLSWPVAALTVTGQPARIAYYRLYGASAPLPRSSINATNLLQDNIAATFIDVPIPAATRFYYNLIVVDARGNLSPY